MGNEVEVNLTIFFRRFLIVHLATNCDMDDYLGFTPPKALSFPYCLPLNPKWASIPSDVFRKHLKKIVRFASLDTQDKALRWKLTGDPTAACRTKAILIGGLISKVVEVGVPLDGQQVFFLVIAFLAGRHDVALFALSTTAQRHHVIHGQLIATHLTSAIMADAGVDPSQPPFTPSQFSRLFFLSLDVLFADLHVVQGHLRFPIMAGHS